MPTSINLNGLNVVVTGAIVGESRRSAEGKLQDAGAIIQSAVTTKTDLLVTGDRVGARKTDAARKFGVRVIAWEDLDRPERAAARDAGRRDTERAARGRILATAKQVAPQLAKKSDEVPSGDGWLFELKWDGYRGIATVRNGKVALQSRSGKSDLAQRFPKIVAALAKLPDCILDGEIVDLSTQGGTFEGLQNGNGSDFVVFDLLDYDGQTIRHLPYDARHTMLEDFLRQFPSSVLHVSPTFADGEQLLAYVNEHGLEGLVAKRRTSPYREGTRTEAWLKIKVRHEQEFVVVGWTPGEGARLGQIGALVLAVWEDADGWQLRYSGRAGSGLPDGTTAESLGLVESDSGPWVVDPEHAPKDVTWVEPDVVAQVAFQRWTEDGRLWHPSFKGIRDDKAADDVVRET